MSVNYNPSVVANGLVLAVDAGNSKSFDSTENLLTYSEDFANGIWQKQNGFSITSNTAIAPDGTLTADTASRVNLSAEFLYQSYGGTPGTFTLSCWVRTVTGTATFNMLAYNGIDGTLGANITHTATTTWQRFSITLTVTTATNWYPCIPTTSNTQFYIWGAQLERGITVSNYYRTTVSVKNRGTTLTDLSNNGNTGTLTNGPTYNSNNGGSIAFDGSNDYIVTPTISNQFLTTGVTISIWFFYIPTTANDNLISWGGGAFNGTSYAWEIRLRGNAGNIEFSPGIGPGGSGTPSRLQYTSPSGWGSRIICIDVTFVSNGVATVYENSVSRATQDYSGIGISSQTNPIWIGRGSDTYFPGRIYSVKVYNRALTSIEIEQNFNATRSRYGI